MSSLLSMMEKTNKLDNGWCVTVCLCCAVACVCLYRYTGLTDDRHPGVSAGERPEVHLSMSGKTEYTKIDFTNTLFFMMMREKTTVLLSLSVIFSNSLLSGCTGQTSGAFPSEPYSEGYSQSGARHVPHQ